MQQRWECRSAEGDGHYFSTPVPLTLPRVTCPNPRHADGRAARPTCLQVLEDTVRTGGASVHFPPRCREHESSAVRMFGFYGKGVRQRQRYQCLPLDGSKSHTCTPPLSREVVNFGVDGCSTCAPRTAAPSPAPGTLPGP